MGSLGFGQLQAPQLIVQHRCLVRRTAAAVGEEARPSHLNVQMIGATGPLQYYATSMSLFHTPFLLPRLMSGIRADARCSVSQYEISLGASELYEVSMRYLAVLSRLNNTSRLPRRVQTA